jgi:signal transduction histidine kinase
MECYSPFEMAHRGAREAGQALRRINESREEELRRLANELHGEAAQMLAAVYLALDPIARDLGPRADERLAPVRARLGDVESQMRRISHEMRPPMLDDLGLMPALTFLAEGVATRAGLSVRVEGSTAGPLATVVETALYRAAQEGLNNVVKHARAATATVRVERRDSAIVLRVTDDGAGFDIPSHVGPAGLRGLGLTGIRERIAPLGGDFEIRSVPGAGTELRLRIPLPSTDHAARPAG